jgi:hypothetical protein
MHCTFSISSTIIPTKADFRETMKLGFEFSTKYSLNAEL